MKTLSSTELRATLSAVMDRVNDDHEPVIVTRAGGKPVVMVSLEDWASMDETTYLIASPANKAALDSAIREARYNDLASLRRRAPPLMAVAHNGGESARAMRITTELGLAVYRLPSSSPANASWSFERKLEAWYEVFRECGLS